MGEVIKTYRQSVPAMRFIGKKYEDKDRVHGGFGNQWGEWFSKGWFEVLEKNCDTKAAYEDYTNIKEDLDENRKRNVRFNPKCCRTG